MTHHYPDLGSASENLLHDIRSTTQIKVVTRHHYGISAKWRLFSQAIHFSTLHVGFGRCCFTHIAQRQSMQNKCYMIILGTPALFIFITSGIEFVSENSPIIKFDPNPVSNGQFSTPESIRGEWVQALDATISGIVCGGWGGGGGGKQRQPWIMIGK